MPLRRIVTICTALLAASLALAQEPEPLRIGLVQPMSGPLAAYGQETQPAIEALVRRINREGGIKSLGGAKIELILADDASQPARSATEVRRLIGDGRISVLAGGSITPQALAVGPVLDEHKVPMLSFFSGSSRSPYLFSLGLPYDRGYAENMVAFIRDLAARPGFSVKRVVTASSNYEAGQQITRFLTEKLKAAGFEVVGDVPLDTKATDFTPALLRIRSLKPDVVVGLQTQREILGLYRGRFDLQYFDPVFVSNLGVADPSIWKDLGDAIATKTLLDASFGLALYAPTLKASSGSTLPRDIAADIGAKGGLGHFAIAAMQGSLVIKEAAERSASRDPARLHQAIASTALPFGHPGMILPREKGLSFAEDRLPVDSTTLIIQWNAERQLEAVFPPAFATAEPRKPRR